MTREHKADTAVYLLFFILIGYLLIGTGLVSDDFVQIMLLKDRPFAETLKIVSAGSRSLIPAVLMLPAEHYLITVWYHFFRINDQILLNILKTAYILLSFYCISKFFGIFVRKRVAALASFLFIFFPSHDATTYWFLGQYLTLSIALYLYAYYLAHTNRMWFAGLFALIASFVSHASPAIAFSLAALAVMNKDMKKASVLLVPNLVFLAYYLAVPLLFQGEATKLPDQAGLHVFADHFALQLLTFLDAMIGPSMWLKVYYAFTQLTTVSIAICAIVGALFFSAYGKNDHDAYDPKLAASLSLLTFLSFLMFAVTGYYPQMTFNLGNRVTIFGSLLIVYLAATLPLSKSVKGALFIILLFSIFGISDHWKAWNRHEQTVFAQIKNNKELQGYRDTKPIYVSGNQYSRYGSMGHIEFLSTEATSASFSDLALHNGALLTPINKRFVYKNGYLIDRKFDTRRKVDEYINVYDSECDKLLIVQADSINAYIDSLPPDIRHWIQLVEVPFIRNLSLKLMPRLRHAL